MRRALLGVGIWLLVFGVALLGLSRVVDPIELVPESALILPALAISLFLAGLGNYLYGRDDRARPAILTDESPAAGGGGHRSPFDQQLHHVGSERGPEQEALTADLRTETISVLTHARDWDEETAAEHLASGTWTDDPLAAALFVDREHLPLGQRLREWLFPHSTFRNRVEAVTDELAEVSPAE